MGTTRKKRLLLLGGASALALQVAAAPVGFDGGGHGPTIRAAHAQEQSCFTAGTMILMADGTERPIQSIRPGDLVVGRRGRVNRVRGCERTSLGRRRLYALNGGRPFVTAEHPFLSAEGWKALDPEATRRESPGLAVAALQLGDQLCRGAARAVGGERRSTPVAPGMLFLQSTVALETLASTDAEPNTPLFNLLLDGDHSYVADGWIVHNKDGGDAGGGSGEGGSADDGSAAGSDTGSADGPGGEASDGGSSGDSGSADGGASAGGDNDSSGGGDSSDGGSAGEGGSSGAGDGGTSADGGSADAGGASGGGSSSSESDGPGAGNDTDSAATDSAAGAGTSEGSAAQGGAADAGSAAPGGAPDGLSGATPSGPAVGGSVGAIQAAPARNSTATAERLVDSVGIDDPADAGLEPTGPTLNREQEQRLIERHWRVRD